MKSFDLQTLIKLLKYQFCILQALSVAEQERSVLSERLNGLQRDLGNANNDFERLKRESLTKQEQDRGTINNLTAELKNFRQQFDETKLVFIIKKAI